MLCKSVIYLFKSYITIFRCGRVENIINQTETETKTGTQTETETETETESFKYGIWPICASIWTLIRFYTFPCVSVWLIISRKYNVLLYLSAHMHTDQDHKTLLLTFYVATYYNVIWAGGRRLVQKMYVIIVIVYYIAKRSSPIGIIVCIRQNFQSLIIYSDNMLQW